MLHESTISPPSSPSKTLPSLPLQPRGRRRSSLIPPKSMESMDLEQALESTLNQLTSASASLDSVLSPAAEIDEPQKRVPLEPTGNSMDFGVSKTPVKQQTTGTSTSSVEPLSIRKRSAAKHSSVYDTPTAGGGSIRRSHTEGSPTTSRNLKRHTVSAIPTRVRRGPQVKKMIIVAEATKEDVCRPSFPSRRVKF